LFQEYAESLGVDLGFQDFVAEVDGLPGKYARPAGSLLIAWRGKEAIGCVAMRRIDSASCEMKRLYVRPSGRGERLGRQLAERICEEARHAGYQRICLDTLPSMTTAQALYASLDFFPTEPYVFNPIEGTKFLARDLTPKGDA
jgi:ribosomal protein S18 acetylase RimI-like enzyme